MTEKYPKQISLKTAISPHERTIAFLLNFSKSIRFYKIKNSKTSTEINLN
jgi:hypothetical protein